MKRLLTIALSAILASTTCIAASKGLKRTSPESVGMDSRMLQLCDSVIASAIANGDTPGAVLCITRNDRIVYRKAYGNCALIPTAEPMTEDTIFDLASLSKCFGTTLSFLQLVEQGKVRLDDYADRFLPDFKPWADSTGRSRRITVRQLLTHTSGLAPYINMEEFTERFGIGCPDSLRKYICNGFERRAEPGTERIYSCPNFITLQYILEEITGERLCDYAQKHIFTPLGLHDTFYLPAGEPIEPSVLARIAPTEMVDGVVLRGAVHDPTARILNLGNSGNAGLFSTADDLAVLCSVIMNGGSLAGKRILSPKTVRAMCTIQDPEFGRTLGWDAASPAAHLEGDFLSADRCICHTGYTGTSVVMDLDEHMAIILLADTAHPYDQGNMGRYRDCIANIVGASVK